MLEFQHVPPSDPRGNSLQLKRCPTSRPLKGIITCKDVLGTATHFYHGRTLPCDSETCPACGEGLPWRWHGYISLYLPKAKQHILFELTAQACEPLKAYREANGSLRGCILLARRANAAPNARVLISTSTADQEEFPLPPEPCILDALSIIWNISRSSMAILGTNKNLPSLQVNQSDTLDRLTGKFPQPVPQGKNGDD